jgi:hypothetical protein
LHCVTSISNKESFSGAQMMINTERLWVCLFFICAPLIPVQAQVYFNSTVGADFTPGVYGQINIDSAPPPPVLYPQPLIAGTPIYGAQPVYVYAPLEEIQNWVYFCGKYAACGVPVYFIQYDEVHPFWGHYLEIRRLPYRARGDERFEQRYLERRAPTLEEKRQERREVRREESREGRAEDWRFDKRDGRGADKRDFRRDEH